MRKKEEVGICKLCGKRKKLSFEHIPPKVAFNKTTKYYSFSQDEYYKSRDLLTFKPKGKVLQGGMGLHCLCKECNSFLGQNYVRPFSDFANIGMHLNYKYDFDFIQITAKNQNPLRVLKQITSMFICISDPTLTEEYPELLEFVLNPDKQELPEKYRFYLYLTKENGQYRKFGFPTIISTHGIICELAFPPFGYVLNIDNENTIPYLTDVTNFKKYNDSRNHEFDITLLRLPTHLHIPLDFRTIKEIEKGR